MTKKKCSETFQNLFLFCFLFLALFKEIKAHPWMLIVFLPPIYIYTYINIYICVNVKTGGNLVLTGCHFVNTIYRVTISGVGFLVTVLGGTFTWTGGTIAIASGWTALQGSGWCVFVGGKSYIYVFVLRYVYISVYASMYLCVCLAIGL